MDLQQIMFGVVVAGGALILFTPASLRQLREENEENKEEWDEEQLLEDQATRLKDNVWRISGGFLMAGGVTALFAKGDGFILGCGISLAIVPLLTGLGFSTIYDEIYRSGERLHDPDDMAPTMTYLIVLLAVGLAYFCWFGWYTGFIW